MVVPGRSLSELVDSIVVDAYGTDEQLTAFLTALDDEVDLPCAAQILGVEIEVVAFDLEGDEHRGLVVRCRRVGGPTDVVSLADVRFESGNCRSVAARRVQDLAGTQDLSRSPARGVDLARGVSP